MEEIFQFVFWEIAGNLFFRVGRLVLRGITLGAVRLENPNRLKMLIVAVFGLLVTFLAALLLWQLVLGWVVK